MDVSRYQAGDAIGAYIVESRLGEGGMGTVYAARHHATGNPVAIKLLVAQNRDDVDLRRRLLREARACASIRSPHVARVFDVGEMPDGSPYVIFEHLVGQDLARVVKTSGPMSVGDAARAIVEACDALAEAHGQGIIHRDVKPSNLFLTRDVDGAVRVKLLDFGIAKVGTDLATHDLTGTNALLGSPEYMSPEQLRGSSDVDGRTDIWGLGATLFFLLSGAKPFSAESVPALLLRVIMNPPTPLLSVAPHVPPALARVVDACLEKDAAKRIPSARDLARLLAPFTQGTIAAGPSFEKTLAMDPPSRVSYADPSGTLASMAFRNQAAPTPPKRRAGAIVGAAIVGTVLLTGSAIAFVSAFGRGHDRATTAAADVPAASAVAVTIPGPSASAPPAAEIATAPIVPIVPAATAPSATTTATATPPSTTIPSTTVATLLGPKKPLGVAPSTRPRQTPPQTPQAPQAGGFSIPDTR